MLLMQAKRRRREDPQTINASGQALAKPSAFLHTAAGAPGITPQQKPALRGQYACIN
jgi:hypothetical protein